MGETLKWYKPERDFDDVEEETLILKLLYSPDSKAMRDYSSLSLTLNFLSSIISEKIKGTKFLRGESVNKEREKTNERLMFFNQYVDALMSNQLWHVPFLNFLRACQFSDASIKHALNQECNFHPDDKYFLNDAAEHIGMPEIFAGYTTTH